MTESTKQTKKCFVVCPIGSAGSETRQRSDDIFNHLILPICNEEGYEAQRALEDSRPGDITQQIIQKVFEADLVVADLTGHNPNVFYELAIRHFSGKPFIHLNESSERLPFDISVLNSIQIRSGTFGGVAKTAEELRSQIRAIKCGEVNFANASFTQYQKILNDVRTSPSDEMKIVLDRLATVEARLVEKEREAREAQKALDAEREARDRAVTRSKNSAAALIKDAVEYKFNMPTEVEINEYKNAKEILRAAGVIGRPESNIAAKHLVKIIDSAINSD